MEHNLFSIRGGRVRNILHDYGRCKDEKCMNYFADMLRERRN